MPEFALFGGTLMVRRAEVNELLTIYKGSARGVATALKLGVRWAADRLRYPRGTRLAMGNALVANLFARLLARGGGCGSPPPPPSWSARTGGSSAPSSPTRAGSCGSARDAAWCWRAAGSPRARSGGPLPALARRRSTPAPPRARRATTLRLAQAVGGALGEPRDDNAFWFPSSVGRRRDGTTAVFPHIWDRAKPGIVAVDQTGRRFVDESVSYHRFVRAMYDAQAACPRGW